MSCTNHRQSGFCHLWKEVSWKETSICDMSQMWHSFYATDCPKLALQKEDKGTNLLMAGIDEGEFNADDDTKFTLVIHGTALQMDKYEKLPKTWILLDNQSTVDVFCQKGTAH